MDKDAVQEPAVPCRRGWTGAALILAVLALFGGWAAALLARSKLPPPPLPPYKLPAGSLDEPLPGPFAVPLAPRQTLRVNNSAEPETLDPTLMTAVPDLTIALALFEGLVGLHPRTLAPVPGMAERWEVSADGLTYRFHLREAAWSDGTPLTAADFVYAWRRALAPETGAKYAQLLWCIAGARDERATLGVQAPDPRTLEVRLAYPVPYFLKLVAFATFAPVPRQAVEAHADDWTRPEHLVCNGPFTLAEWRQQQRIVLRTNPRYWDAARVALAEVHVLAVTDAETSLKMYRAGEVDWIRSVPAPKAPAVGQMPGARYAPEWGTYFYRLNATRPPLDDRRVRQALNLAIDKEALARYLLRGGQRPARSFVPPLLPDYQPVQGPACDPEAARRLLAEAGYPGGRGLRPLEILYSTSEANKLIAEALQAMWGAELGVRVRLLNQESKVYRDAMKRGQYDIAHSSWIGDYDDPNTFLDLFLSDGGNNRTGWGHPRYDDLIHRAAREVDPQRRVALLQEAERILVRDEAPIIPLYFYVNVYLVHPKVLGVWDNARNVHPFQYIAIAAD